jgi:hypothetical protein
MKTSRPCERLLQNGIGMNIQMIKTEHDWKISFTHTHDIGHKDNAYDA